MRSLALPASAWRSTTAILLFLPPLKDIPRKPRSYGKPDHYFYHLTYYRRFKEGARQASFLLQVPERQSTANTHHVMLLILLYIALTDGAGEHSEVIWAARPHQ